MCDQSTFESCLTRFHLNLMYDALIQYQNALIPSSSFSLSGAKIQKNWCKIVKSMVTLVRMVFTKEKLRFLLFCYFAILSLMNCAVQCILLKNSIKESIEEYKNWIYSIENSSDWKIVKLYFKKFVNIFLVYFAFQFTFIFWCI